jgi:hypothetical protein
MNADTLLNLLVWGLVVFTIIVLIVEYAGHRGTK